MASPTDSSAPSGLPTGISAPLATTTANDKAGMVAILTAFSLSLMLVSFPIRTYARSKVGRYKSDDYAFLGASAFSICQAAAVFYQLRCGLGKSEDLIDPKNIVPMQKAAYASDILYIITLFLSKCSTAFLFLRLTPGRGHFLAIWGTISTSIIWAVASVFVIALRCHPAHPWTDTSSACTGLFARWEFVGILDCITEAGLFGISVYLVWNIQMSMKSKTIVVCAFGCRLPVIAIAGLRLYFLHISLNSTNPTLLSANTVSCTQLEIGYSIMASIVPCLKTFMAPYDRPLEGPNTQYKQYGYGGGTIHKLSSLASNSSQTQNISAAGAIDGAEAEDGKEGMGRMGRKFMGKLRPEQTVYEARVVTRHDDGAMERISGDSGNSRKMIIKKGVEWSVDYDGRNRSPGSREDDHYTIEEVNALHERERKM